MSPLRPLITHHFPRSYWLIHTPNNPPDRNRNARNMADDAPDKSATPARKTCNSRSANTKRWRVNKKERELAIIGIYNKRRAEQNLPPVSLDFQHVVPFRGGALPKYFPPPEQAKKMTDNELQTWRATERKKRKAEAMKENRKAKKALIEHIKRQLLAEENISAEELEIITENSKTYRSLKKRCAVTKLEQESDKKSPAQLSGGELSKTKGGESETTALLKNTGIKVHGKPLCLTVQEVNKDRHLETLLSREGESETITQEKHTEKQVHGKPLCLTVQEVNKDRFLGTLLSKERVQTHFSAAVSAAEKIGPVVDKRRSTFNTLIQAAENFTGKTEKLEHSDAVEDAKNLLAFKRSPRLEI